MTLDDLGYAPSFADAFAASASSNHHPARIVRLDGRLATVIRSGGTDERVAVPKRIRAATDPPVVGDWVAVDPNDGTPRIARLLPRKTVVARRAAGRKVRRQVLAANIDVVFIVSSMDTDFNVRRLERYLTVVADGGAMPVIVLTKAGLVERPDDFVRRARAVAPDAPVHAIDVIAGLDPDAPLRHLGPGRTAVLVGSSGVGKSTLANAMTGRMVMETHGVRERDGQGQHTTAHRELFVMGQRGIVIDTPGLRELSLWADHEAVDRAFSDIEALAAECRFGDCSHEHEPGCAVRAATEDGRLDAGRLAGYLALSREATVARHQMAEHERRAHSRKQGRLYRDIIANKRNRR